MENSLEKPIDQVLLESKKQIEEKTNETIKKRGRPKNSTTGNVSQQIPINNSSNIHVNNSQTDYTASLEAVFAFSGQYLKTVTKYDDFALSDEESKMLAVQGNEVLKQFAPQINSKYATLGMFTISLCGIFGMKYMGYKMHIQNQLDIKKQNATIEHNNENNINENNV